MKPSKIVNIRPIATMAPPAGSEPAVAPLPLQSAVAFKEVLRLMGGAAAIGPAAAAVVFNQASAGLMRQLVARYGFDRLPATFGEFLGLFEYCDSLDAASGFGTRPKAELGAWQAASFVVWRRRNPALMPAIERFCAGHTEALLVLHQQQGTLAALGRDYVEIED